jgi:ankyrin repeat protein
VLGNTPLHVACSRNAYDCVRWLLFRGARTDIKNQTSQTPLDVAEVSNNPKIVELLKNWKFMDVGKSNYR